MPVKATAKSALRKPFVLSSPSFITRSTVCMEARKLTNVSPNENSTIRIAAVLVKLYDFRILFITLTLVPLASPVSLAISLSSFMDLFVVVLLSVT
jgi:hypothetical protein